VTAQPERIVVVGASLAGLAAAQRLRERGFSGALTLVGDEPHPPYDRPPLSKQVLRGLYSADTTLPRPPGLRAEFRLGRPATRLDLSERVVELGDGSRLPYDRLLIATGTRARPWPNPEEAALTGVFTLRGRDDAQRLGACLQAKPRRVVLVGGGFIGFEVASTCRDLDIPVTLLVRDAVPLAAALGARLGGLIGEVARERGVDLRLESEIERMEAENGRLVAVTLKDGERIETDCLVAAIGTLRNVEWLAGSGVQADAKGLRCDAFCRVLREDGRVAEGVFAAGDVARWPNPHDDDALVAVEHWGQRPGASRNRSREHAGGRRLGDAPPRPPARLLVAAIRPDDQARRSGGWRRQLCRDARRAGGAPARGRLRQGWPHDRGRLDRQRPLAARLQSGDPRARALPADRGRRRSAPPPCAGAIVP
jgi:NADPH-dependent 2,4-dienoyl-CoA reductase/sulfur reductase-like enzyme